MLAAIQREYEPTAATASVTDSLPALDDTTPQCSMLRTESQQPDETPFSMRMAQEIPNQTAATVWPLVVYHVPYSITFGCNVLVTMMIRHKQSSSNGFGGITRNHHPFYL